MTVIMSWGLTDIFEVCYSVVIKEFIESVACVN